jgi:hypothetical protein
LEKVKRGVFDVVTTKITNEDINSFLSEADEQLSKGIEVGKT